MILSMKDIIDNAPFSMIMKLSDNIDYHENEGYLYCYNVIMGRTGVQKYRAYELGLEGNDIIDVYRDEADVFHEDTIKSLIGKSVVYNHPIEGDVTSKNYKRLEAGTVLDAWRDGDNIVGNIVVKDATTIQAIQDGIRELSLGYNAKIVEEDGKYYQKEIRMNHLAVLEAGRAGNARIIDGKGDDGTVPDKVKLSFLEKVKALFTVKDGDIVVKDFEDNKNETQDFKDVELEKGEQFSFSDGKRMYVYNENTVTTTVYDDDTGEEVSETISITKRVYKRLDENGQVQGFYDEDGNLIEDIDSIKVIDTSNPNENINENTNTNNINDTTNELPNENSNENNKENGEEGDGNNMKLTFKDAMIELKELQALPDSEFKTKAIEELNTRAIADGLGSIIPIEKPKVDEKGKKDITDTADPANNIVDEKPAEKPKVYNFTAENNFYNKFFDGMLAVNHKDYDTFKENSRKYVDVKDKDIAEGVI